MSLKTSCQFVVLVSLLSATAAISSNALPLRTQAGRTPANCKPEILPPMVLSQIKADYGSWKIQDLSDLSLGARQEWEYKKYGKPSECPGIAIGQFENANQSYAVLLVPRSDPDSAYRFLVFSRRTSRTAYQLTILEKSDDPGVRNIFIRTVRLSDFFNDESRNKLDVRANQGILFVEAGENQYGANVFFWTRNGYRHEPRES